MSRFRASPLARRFVSGSIWSLSGAVGGKGLTLISSFVAARMLGRAHYGEFGMIQSTVISFGLTAGLGMGLTATTHVAEFRHSDPKRVGRIISLARRITLVSGIATAAIVFIFADKLASKLMAAPYLATEVRVASVLLLLYGLNGAQDGSLYGFEAFSSTARTALIGGFTNFLLTIVGVYFFGLNGAIAAVALAACVTWTLNSRAISRQMEIHHVPRHPDKVLSEWPTLWRFSLPAILSTLSVVPVNWACNLILANQPNGYAEIGLLNAAVQWRNIILFVPGILTSVLLPMLANLRGTGEHHQRRKVLFANVAAAAVIGLGAALLVALASKWIMAGYGAEFAGGREVLVLQAFAAALAATLGVMGQFLVSSGEMWWLIGLQVIWASVNVGLTWAFRSHGAVGLASAYLIAYVVHTVTMTVLTLRKLNR